MSKIIKKYVTSLKVYPLFVLIIDFRGFVKSTDLWKSLMKLDNAIDLIVRAWESENLDVVICPGFTYPAPPITNPGRIVPAICYPAVFNVLDFPVGVVPITRVNDQDQVMS